MTGRRLANEQAGYILRVVGLFEDDAAGWEATMRFAEEGHFDAVMLFNTHGEMPPHPPPGEIRRRVPLLAARFADIRKRGLSPMLNYFVTLGHGAAKPAAGMAQFQAIVDGFGNMPMGCVCPLDEAFGDYLSEAFGLYAAAGADSIWIDDDFRLYGRDGAETLQCFCPLHLGRFAVRTGRSLSREELYAELMKTDPPDRQLRNDWFAVQGESLLRLAERIRDAVTAASPGTGLGMMVVPPHFQAFSGRDLDAELLALRTAAQPKPWLRTGGGFYNDERPLDLLDKMVGAVDPLPAMVQAPAHWCSEIENYPFPAGYKSARVLELEMYLNTISTGGLLTFSIHDAYLGMHDPSGNVTPMLRAVKPYLREVVRARQGKTRRGASFPYRNDLVQVRELTPAEFGSRWNVNLSRLGIAQAPTDASPLLLVGTTADLYTDEEIGPLLERGAILDAEAYWILRQRGLLADCPIEVRKDADVPIIQSERVVAGFAPDWLRNKRLAVRWHVGYLPGYSLWPMQGAAVWSDLLDTEGNVLSAGVIVADKPCRMAVVLHNGEPMRELGRQWLMQMAVNEVAQGACRPAMVEGALNYYPVWWEGENEALLGLSDFGLESFRELSLWLPADKAVAAIERLGRDGVWKPADYRVSDHPACGFRVLLTGDSVPAPLSFETFRLTYG